MVIDETLAREVTRGIKELGADMADGFSHLRRADAELKSYVDVTVADAINSAERRMASRLGEKTDSTLRTEIARLETKMNSGTAQVEAALRRTGSFGGETRDGRDTPEAKAFSAYLRRGDQSIEATERKALMAADDPRGGYLAPSQMVNEVLRQVREFSPVRQISRNIETAAGEIDFPLLTSGPVAQWVGETETRPSTDATFGGITIPLHELACYVDVTVRLLEDSAITIETLLAILLGEAFAGAEGQAFLRGSGSKRPLGVLMTPGLPTVASGNATAITDDSLFDVFSSLKQTYQNAATWMMSRQTFGQLRKFKSSTGEYLFSEGNALVNGAPVTLLGRPVMMAVDMPAVAAGSVPVLVGDFGRGFVVANKIGTGALNILRDPFSVATQGMVRFHCRLRTGGAVVMPEALAAIVVSA